MKIFRDFSVACDVRGASVAIGNFDGVHLGHQSVLELARTAMPDAPWGCVTFEPHPRRLFRPDDPAFRLMSASARAGRLNRVGLDVLYEVPFSRSLATLGPQDFVEQVLCRAMGVAHVVVGHDFRFGIGRSGDVEALTILGQAAGFSVGTAPILRHGGQEISSSAIRTALAEGRPADAARMLGHWHQIEGPVLHGFKRGRGLGFPTANVALDDVQLPRFGVYASLADVLTGPAAGHYQGVASIGIRPMFDDRTAPNLEVFLFDFDRDIYGQMMSVALVEFLRPEEVFDTVNSLVARMHSDCALARNALEALPAPHR
ncbi:MAG: bifunctional riboflavin kinase/FAD synthetase [Rhodobacteraceae bacterium]|nr:bifunctional riboflavin kinase/FAD synthetase [Paracoccaceae bacterium]